MDQHVAIPTRFFLEEAKREYSDHRTRLFQELLQNSLDAGATVICFTVSNTSYICQDNGRGMSKERMVSALLTMGGSAKDAGATGGFGAAKKLLLFAHDYYAVQSNSTAVEGAGLSYKFVDRPAIQGTVVSAKFSFDFCSGYDMKPALTDLLRKCNFRGRAEVYVNGERFSEYLPLRRAREVPGLGVLSTTTVESNYAFVLHNGLYMFCRYISGMKRTLVVEVSAPSVEMFAQSRESFRPVPGQIFDNLMAEAAIDKKSFIKSPERKFVVEGVNSFIAAIYQEVNLSEMVANLMKELSIPSITSVSQFTDTLSLKVLGNPLATVDDIKTVETIKKMVLIANKIETNFYFDLADSSYRKVPQKFIPSLGKPKYTFMAAMWKVCVREVLKANKMNQNFTVGFTFNSEADATYSMHDMVGRYMLNPTGEVDTGTKQEKVMKMLTTAVHEVVHSTGVKYHDENFVRKFHDLLVPVLTSGPTWRQLVKMAKAEKI